MPYHSNINYRKCHQWQTPTEGSSRRRDHQSQAPTGKMYTASPTRNRLPNKPKLLIKMLFYFEGHQYIYMRFPGGAMVKKNPLATWESVGYDLATEQQYIYICKYTKQRSTTWSSWKSRIYKLKVYITNYPISGIWSCLKHPCGHLVHTQRSCQKHVWSCQKTSRLRKHPWVQRASNISLYFWFTGLRPEKYYHVVLV